MLNSTRHLLEGIVVVIVLVTYSGNWDDSEVAILQGTKWNPHHVNDQSPILIRILFSGGSTNRAISV